MTTYRLLAADTIKKAKKYLQSTNLASRKLKSNKLLSTLTSNKNTIYSKIIKVFGAEAATRILEDQRIIDMGLIENTGTSWAELIYSARFEQVIHLDDLLLRRSRLGLLLENGGANIFDEMEEILAPELGYTKTEFQIEKDRYQQTWKQSYSTELL